MGVKAEPSNLKKTFMRETIILLVVKTNKMNYNITTGRLIASVASSFAVYSSRIIIQVSDCRCSTPAALSDNVNKIASEDFWCC